MSYAIFDGTQKWPFAKLPFSIDGLSFPPGSVQRASIDNAVNAWNAGTAVVRIVPRQNEPDYVQFIPDEVLTASQVGCKGGPQDIQASYFPAIPTGATVSAINQLADQVDCFYFDGGRSAAGQLGRRDRHLERPKRVDRARRWLTRAADGSRPADGQPGRRVLRR